MRSLVNLLKTATAVAVLFFVAAAQVSAVEVSSKEVRKRVKELEKEGWKTMDLSLEQQVAITMERRLMLDEDGYDKYVSTTAEAKGGSYSAAQMAAENIAKVRLANNMGASVASLANVALESEEISAMEATSITSASEKAKILVSQKLGKVLTSMCVYRKVDNQYEVRVTVMYDQRKAIDIAHELMMAELGNDEKLSGVVSVEKIRDSYKDNGFNE